MTPTYEQAFKALMAEVTKLRARVEDAGRMERLALAGRDSYDEQARAAYREVGGLKAERDALLAERNALRDELLRIRVAACRSSRRIGDVEYLETTTPAVASDVPAGANVDSYYSRGICVY